MGIIYQAKNKINGKCYIGKTSGLLENRKWGHENDSLKGSKLVFHRALRKYGFSSFQWKVLVERDGESELNNSEIMYIRLLKAKLPNGYNMTDGGNGGPLMKGRRHTLETKQKMSLAKKGRTLTKEHKIKIGLAGIGRFCSVETRKKRSISRTGIYHTEETKAKIRQLAFGNKNRVGTHHTKETKAKMRQSALGNKHAVRKCVPTVVTA